MKLIFICMIPAAGLSFLVHLILHEIGHYLGGLCTGWRLINLQIYHYTIVKEKNKLRYRYLPSKNYQCIMYPKSINAGATVYTAGGYWMNLLLAVIGLLLMLIYIMNVVVWTFSWCLFGIGITFYLINGLPNTRRVCNDKACNLLLQESEKTRACHNSQLLIARYLNEGITYQGIGEKLICITGGKAENDILAYQAVLEYYFYLEANNFDMMRKSLDHIAIGAPISKGVKDIICLEKLYSELMLRFEGMITEPIRTENYGLDIRQYIKEHETTGDVHSVRVKAVYDTYESYMMGTYSEALLLLNTAIIEVKSMNCLYEGERAFCLCQLSRIRDLCMS